MRALYKKHGWALRTLLALCLCLAQAQAKPSQKDSEKEVDEDGIKSIKGKPKTITLSLGVSRTLEFPFEIGPIYLTDPSLFEYRRIKEGDKDKKLFLLPKSPGYTDMTVHDANGLPKLTYFVRVTREDVGRIIAQLEELLGDIEGLQIKPLDGSIVLDGEILLPRDMARIFRVLNALKDRDPKKKEIPIRNLATISKMTLNILAERIEREIGSPEITVRVINNNLFIEGTAESEFEADRAIEIAKLYLPEAVVDTGKSGDGVEVRPRAAGGFAGAPSIIDMLRVRPPAARPPSQDILITINFVELKNDYDKSFNFTWRPLSADNSTIKYDSGLGELSANFVATISSLFPKLNTAKSHGHARILKQEQIVVKDRAEAPAVIESSVDVYTSVTNEKGERSLQPIAVPNVFKVKAATIPGSDSLELGVQIQLSSIVGSNPPQIARANLQTQVTIKNGDSAALGGHSINEAVASYNRDGAPGGGGGNQQNSGTPLFNLNRSKNFNTIKQQYVIFVTAEILRTASSATESITRKFRLNGGER